MQRWYLNEADWIDHDGGHDVTDGYKWIKVGRPGQIICYVCTGFRGERYGKGYVLNTTNNL